MNANKGVSGLLQRKRTLHTREIKCAMIDHTPSLSASVQTKRTSSNPQDETLPTPTQQEDVPVVLCGMANWYIAEARLIDLPTSRDGRVVYGGSMAHRLANVICGIAGVNPRLPDARAKCQLSDENQKPFQGGKDEGQVPQKRAN